MIRRLYLALVRPARTLLGHQRMLNVFFALYWAVRVVAHKIIRLVKPAPRPRIAILSMWDQGQAELGAITGPNKAAYARVHGHDWLPQTEGFIADRPVAWSKIYFLREILPRYDWVMWSDADSVITNPAISLRALVDQPADLLITRDQNGVNTGSFLVRNCAWSRRFLDQVWAMPASAEYQSRYELWSDRMWENRAFLILFNRAECRRHARILPQRALNSYDPELTQAGPASAHRPGDFVLHLPGIDHATRLTVLTRHARPAAHVRARPVNIGLLTRYLALGENADSGIGQHFRVLADALAAEGHRVHVVHPTLEPEAARAAFAALSPAWTCDVVPVHTPRQLDRLLRRSWPSRVFMAEICAALAGDRAMAIAAEAHSLEIIETHATATPALFYLQRRRRLPVLTRVSTTLSQLNAASNIRSRVKTWQAAVERFVVRRSDALVTHTRKHRDVLCALDGCDPRAFALVPHGLPDIAAQTPEPAPPNPAPEILFVGRFEHRKGVDVLLEAIPAVLAARPQARVTLAGATGDGSAWETFKRLHPQLAGDRVVALGAVSPGELGKLYERCDLVAAPSRYESFGLVYVEAMRHAKPVVGCDVGGIPEVVTDGVTGMLARPGDAASLARCLLRLLDDPALRLRLGRAGREDFSRRFSATRMAGRSVELYRQIIAAHAAPTL